MRTDRKTLAIDLLILTTLVVFSIFMRYEGWRSKYLGNWDMLLYYLGADSFLWQGQMMDRGDLSSYHSYSPPGTVYVVLPGMVVSNDVRLFALPGEVVLNIATIFFLYLISRQAFGRGLALAIGVVYGASRLVFFGAWPVGHPAYILGTLWFLMQWIRRRSAWWFFAALVIGLFGLYVDLAILPFFFVIPFLWLLFRPPLRVLPLLLAGMVGLVIWFPFLRFEASRDFADLKSILFLRGIPSPSGPDRAPIPYCYATIPGEPDIMDATGSGSSNTVDQLQRIVYWEEGAGRNYYICKIVSNLDRNFDEPGLFLVDSSGLAAGLWFLFLIGLFLPVGMAIIHGESRIGLQEKIRRLNPRIVLVITAFCSLLVFFILDPTILGKILRGEAFYPSTRIEMEQLRYFIPPIIFSGIMGVYLGMRTPKRDLWEIAPLLVVWIPWLLLVLLGEPGRPERFWWIWPLQVVAMVFALWQIFQEVMHQVWIKRIAIIAAAVMVFPLTFYLPAFRDWAANGYAGQDGVQVQVVDFLHQEIERADKEEVSIGYRLLSTYWGTTQPEDTRLRQGSWFDLLLETRWGIRNKNTGADQLSSSDTWRILEVEDPSPSFPSPWEGYSPIKTFELFVIYRLENE